ncbi:MAG TPA: NAD(P)-dependent oxidoreductase [Acetobacteraceae bacterium]|nr:NAD(P)-dependent oxidoreductase [Acetobacteraceae bacterium]
MLPLALDLSDWPVLLVGDGRAALARLDMLEAAGTRRLMVFAEAPSAAMRDRAGPRLVERLPTDAEVAEARLLFMAGLDHATTARLAALARTHRVLVNAEDVPPLCDAYALAMVRRGNLVIGVSTEGRSPAVARVLRQWLERRFGPEWEARFEQAVALRQALRGCGAAPAEITEATAGLLAPWLDPPGMRALGAGESPTEPSP